MHVFVTGGTGTVGTAVVAELLGNGHAVLALARSERSAQTLEAAGAEVLRGELADLDTLRAGAAQSDGVISLAFSPGYGTADALAAAVAEESAGVRATAVRLPRTVHNEGKGGFAGMLTEQARRRGVAGYPGDGTQRWPGVHALDAAVLFRLALESAPAGTAWHAVADEGDAVSDIATVIGRRLGLPVQAVPEERFGPFGPIFAMDQPASSVRTREALRWTPTHPSVLDDLENIQP
jgi:nucleoside-diphosphate-sugar epimerase